MIININEDVILPIYREDLLDYSSRYLVLLGGAASGKSYYVAQKLIIKSLKSIRKTLVLRKFGVYVKDSVFELLLEILRTWNLYEYCIINLSTFTITLPNGSQFICRGLDSQERLKSIQGITDIWLEECSEFTIDDATQCDLRLRSNVPDSQLIYTLNPTSKAIWPYPKWFKEDAIIASDTKIIKTTYKDNPYLPEAYIQSLEQMIRTNPNWYKIYVLGEFTSLDKLIYNNWNITDFNHKDIKGTLCIGLDWGYVNDATAIIASVVDDSNKIIYIFDEFYQTGLLNDKIADILKYKGYAKEIIVADNAEPKSIDELKRLGIPRLRACFKGGDSVMHGIQRLQQYQIIVHPSCTNTITELENYSYVKDRNTNEYINKAMDDYNHLLDSLRYSIQIIGNDNKLKVMNKSAFGF